MAQINERVLLCLLLILAMSVNTNVAAQDTIAFHSLEDTLSRIFNKIYKLKDDSSRIVASTVFFEKFKSALSLQSAFNYPFDSLTGISRMRSDDGKIRVITWNVPLNNGSSRYQGFVAVKEGGIFELKESSALPADWNNKILPSDSWYGAVYYKLITTRYNKETFYTLLGWDGNNESSNIKVIDIISLNEHGIPCFGKPIFKTREGIRNRIVIEYAEKASVLLRYDYQSLMIPRGKKVKYKKVWLIVTDRLIPMTPAMEGLRKYYVPSGDTYDAFLFDKGFWTFVEDIMVGNSSH